MEQKVNQKYKPLFFNNARYIVILGGRGAGRSTVASQYALSRLMAKDYFRCAIMRYILGDIRNSIYREINDRIEEQGVEEKIEKNDSLMKLSFLENSINAVGFRKSSGDQKSKLKSLASYNCVIIEEADEVLEEDFMQLDDSLRTVKGDIKIILLLNPPAKNHWIVQRWLNLIPSEQKDFYRYELRKGIDDTVLINTNYRDNLSNLAPASVAQYEKYKETKPSHYWNMIEGLIPETVAGKIYNNWKLIDEIPHEARLIRRGQDYGYTIDPSVIVDIYYYNGGYIIDEQLYQKAMSNRALAEFKLGLPSPSTLTIADGAEPKSIDEERSYGVNIIGSNKGAGTVAPGIQFVQDQKISVTRRSRRTWKAYENYAWKIDKNGDVINEPDDRIHEWSNSMDAIRYGMENLRPLQEDSEIIPDDTNLFEGGYY